MPKILEKPEVEMARHIRVIAGKARPGERDEDLRTRAARKLGISASRARVFWYGETENIRSDEMDRARELAFVAPIEKVEDATKQLEEAVLDALVSMDEFRGELRARLAAALGGPARRVGRLAASDVQGSASRREGRGPQTSPHGAAVAR